MSPPGTTVGLMSLVTRAAHDCGGINPMLVDVTNRFTLTNAFVVILTSMDRRVCAIAEDITDRIWAKQQRCSVHTEGRTEGTWVLLDYSGLPVYVLSEEEREYYTLERLWGGCSTVPIGVDVNEARAAAAGRAAAHGAESVQ